MSVIVYGGCGRPHGYFLTLTERAHNARLLADDALMVRLRAGLAVMFARYGRYGGSVPTISGEEVRRQIDADYELQATLGEVPPHTERLPDAPD